MKLYQMQRTPNLVKKLWAIFFKNSSSDPRHLKRKRKPILAREVLAQIKGSPVTINKAKKALLIQSKKIAGNWVWYHPKRSLEDALEHLAAHSNHPDSRIYKAKVDHHERDKRSLIEALTECFGQFNYMVSSAEAIGYLRKAWNIRQRGHFFSEAKKELDIQRVLVDGCWYWVWSDENVIEWLQQQLENGPLPASVLYERAMKEKNWSEYVLIHCKQRFRGFRYLGKLGTDQQWYDVNSWSPPAQPDKPDPDVIDITGEY